MSSKQIIGAVVVLLVAGLGSVAQATFVETWDGAEWSSGNQIATNNGWEDQGNSAGWVHDGEGYLGTRGATSDTISFSYSSRGSLRCASRYSKSSCLASPQPMPSANFAAIALVSSGVATAR